MADFMYASGCGAAIPKLEDIGTQLQTQGTKLQAIRNELGKWQGYSGIGSSMEAICGELDTAKGQIGILSSTLSKIAECYHNTEQSITENGATYRRTEDKAGKKEDTKEVEVDLDKWLESDYKLSKEEVKKAKELLDKYFADGSTAQKMRDSNNANYIMVLRNSMSDEEYSEYQKMVALANKTSVAASITTGAFESVPFLGKIRDGLNSYIAEAEGRTVEEVSKSEYANKNSMRQHPVGTVAGFVLGSIAVQEAIEGAVGEIFSKGGSAAAYESGSKSTYKILNTSSAEDVNKIFKDTMGYEPPYKLGTSVTEIQLTENATYVRVYDKVNSRMQGGWVMKAEDIVGLTPQEIQNKFALPNTPKYICDVNLEVGTRLRTGEVNPLFGFDGGGQQYDLIINGKNVGTFTNERIIGQ